VSLYAPTLLYLKATGDESDKDGRLAENPVPTFSLRMRESLVSAELNFCIEVINGEMPNFRNKTAILKTSTVRSLF
jgi:hypothetical protein